jgi:branched-chain amino acid transport system permease protein
MSAAAEDVVTEAPAVEAVPKRAMTLGTGVSLAILLVLLVVPFLVKNFWIFQMTKVLYLGLAVLALNILTGGSGQFSLGQSAFFALGAYTSAILIEHANMNYALTLPLAGLVSFGAGYLFGKPALRLSGVYLALATFALATAMPQLLKLNFLEHWTGGVQGLTVTKPDAPFGLPISPDMWLYFFTLAITVAIYVGAVNLLRSRSGRAFMAIRDNEIAASAMGVNVAFYKTLAFGVSAGITGIAGALEVISVQFAAPDSYTINLAINLFLGMVVGGVGWLPGSFVGSAFIIFVPNIAESISKGLSGAVFGVLLFIVIFLVPHGARQVAIIAQRGGALDMSRNVRLALALGAIALAVLWVFMPMTLSIQIATFVLHIPVLLLLAATAATAAALGGDRFSAIIVPLVALHTFYFGSQWAWLFTVAGLAPLIGLALHLRAGFIGVAAQKSR